MPEINIIYIAGAGRSGSTLLDAILGESNNAFSLGEVRQIWKYLLKYKKAKCSCGKIIFECPFWEKILLNIFKNSPPTEKELETIYRLQKIVESIPILNPYNRKKFMDQNQEKLKEYSNFIWNLYKFASDLSGCKTLIDSSKLPHYLYILKDLPVNLYVLHLVRDPRGVAYSWTKEKFNPSSGEHMKKHHPFTSARIWNIFNLGTEKFRNQNYILIKYEDLTENIMNTLKYLNNILNLKGSFHIEGNTIKLFKEKHLIGGNPAKFSFQKEIQIKKDTEWLKKLSIHHKLLVSFLTFPLMKKFKYSFFK
jgi:hypothetical protein